MIKGIHHIGVAVSNLDRAVAFYQEAVDLTVDTPQGNTRQGNILQENSRQARTALLNGRTVYLELTQLADPQPEAPDPLPVFGPGITHICFQSPVTDPAFEKFKQQGATMVSRGDRPVKLSRRDITYVYLRDEAGNMFEVEQWDDPPKPFPIWIAHVALVSPNIERLSNFYSTVILGMDAAPEIQHVSGIPTLDIVGNLDDIDLYGTWIPTPNILIEIWQFVNPPTPAVPVNGSLDKPGYTHICFEVDDMGQEVARLKADGVPFVSEVRRAETYESIFGHDPDGNLFELRQFFNQAASLSVDQLDFG